VEEICRKLGVSEATFYRWKKQFAGMRPVKRAIAHSAMAVPRHWAIRHAIIENPTNR
jgi:hypothetical protein